MKDESEHFRRAARDNEPATTQAREVASESWRVASGLRATPWPARESSATEARIARRLSVTLAPHPDPLPREMVRVHYVKERGPGPAVSAAKCDRCLSGSDGDFPVMADQRPSLSCEATVTMNST